MILQHNTSPTIVSEGLETTQVGISAKKASGYQKVLRDYVYTNKILAPIRELACNATDEHNKHKIERPVEIGIRNSEDGQYELFVRDFAKGLSDYDIKNVLFCYLDSTKDKSNDENGGFGVGAMSPNAYTDTFYANSHFNGIVTSYIVTLGRDDYGMSVGNIITVSSSPTDESGIEVIVPIQRGDYYKFRENILNFVRFCPSNIVAKILSDEDKFPEVFSTEIQKGDYKFRIYDYPSLGGNVFYQQGDVIYKTNFLSGLNKTKVVVINIPIGRISLPISREAFEDTRANTRVLEEIEGHIKTLEDEDMANFANYSVDDLLKDKDNEYFIGNIFTCKKTKIFPGTAQIIQNLQRTMYGENTPDFETFEGKTVIGIIPNNKAKEMWQDRVMDYSSEINKKYWMIVDNPYIVEDRLSDMIKNYFVFKKVKSKFFPMKKRDAPEKRTNYIVCEKRSYRTNKNDFSPLELHNHVRAMYNMEEAEDLEEAKLQMDDMEYRDSKMLNMFTIEKSSNGSYCPYWWSTSQKMRDQMYEIGWFNQSQEEYRKINQKIQILENQRRQEEELLENCYPKYIVCGVSEKRKKNLKKRLNRAKQMVDIIDRVRQESSIRGKIITNFLDHSYYAPKMSRHEFRQIMKMKLTTQPIGV